MKKSSFKIFVKKISGAVLISAFAAISSAAAQIPVHRAFHETSATIKYLGADNDSYLFNVAYNNESGEKFLLRITDAEGTVLYASNYSDKKFDKRFRLLKAGSDGRVNFIIKNLKDNSVQAFEVRAVSQVVEDVVIKKTM